MNNEVKAAILLILLSFIVGTYAYALLPSRVIAYWNIAGQPDGYLPKAVGVFLGPDIILVLFLIFIIVPRMSQFRANVDTFRADYYRFMLSTIVAYLVLYLQAILWNMGLMISFNLTLPILSGCLFFYIGVVLKNSKRNWFIGIMTPLLSAHETIWDQTHKTAGNFFEVAGVLSVLSGFVSPYAFLAVLGLLVIGVLGLMIYTHTHAKSIANKKNPPNAGRNARNRRLEHGK
jgi:uncharacterized membrane protein